MERVLQFILPHCERWRKLCLRIGGGVESFQLIRNSFQHVSVPLLQHLEYMYEGECTSADHPHGPLFILVPKLSKLKLCGLSLGCSPPLVNLTSFHFDSKTFTMTQLHLESIAAACPDLQVLHLRVRAFMRESLSNDLITFPSLCELSLNLGYCASYTRDPDNVFHLFSMMVAPVLNTLELVSWHIYEEDLDSLSSNFQKFPHPQPQTLKLSRIVVDYDVFFRYFPTVTSLYLLQTSAEDTPTLSLLPALKSFTYTLEPQEGSEKQRDDVCIRWLYEQVQECYGTPRAMDFICINSSVRELEVSGGAETGPLYRKLRSLVNLVELPDHAEAFQHAWMLSDEFEMEEDYEEEFEEDYDDELDEYWEDYADYGNNSDYDEFEDENEWESD